MTKRKNRTAWLTPRRVGGIGCVAALALAALFTAVLYQQVRQLFRPPVYGGPGEMGGTQDVAVTRGAIDDGIFAYGQVAPARRASLGFRVARGKVLSFPAAAGMQVAAGQVLVQLDEGALERGLAKARADLLAAQKELDALTAAGNTARRLQLEVELSQAREKLDEARRALQAYDAGEGTPRARRAEAAADLDAARAALAELRESTSRREQINELQGISNRASSKHNEMLVIPNPSEQDRDVEWLLRIDALRAREALESARLGYEMEVRAGEQAVVTAERELAALDRAIAAGSAAVERARLAAAVKQALAEVGRLEARLGALDEDMPVVAVAEAEAKVLKLEGAVADAEAALAEAQLVAPFDGLVEEANMPAGEMVAGATPLVTLLDITTLKVEISVPDVDLPKLKEGQEVRVSFDAFQGQPPLAGTLGEIPLNGEFDGLMTVFKVPVAVDLGGAQLWVGMGANAYIPLERKEDVLLVPAAALQYDGVESFVWLVKGKGVERRTVKLGIVDGVMAEVIEGLQEGDQVRMPLQGPVGPGPIYYGSKG